MENKELKKAIESRINASGGRLIEMDVRDVGFPQYMIILPGGHIGFVEIGEASVAKQKAKKSRITELRNLGCAACLVDNDSQINRLVMYILSDAGKDPTWNAYQDSLKRSGGGDAQ